MIYSYTQFSCLSVNHSSSVSLTSVVASSRVNAAQSASTATMARKQLIHNKALKKLRSSSRQSRPQAVPDSSMTKLNVKTGQLQSISVIFYFEDKVFVEFTVKAICNLFTSFLVFFFLYLFENRPFRRSVNINIHREIYTDWFDGFETVDDWKREGFTQTEY